jgi:aspartate aminotransferase
MPEPHFAPWVDRITASVTLAVQAESDKLTAQGIDVLNFGLGEPDFPTPDHIKRAAVRALEENRTKYTNAAGIAPLRQAVVDWHAREMGSHYVPAECVVSVGGKHAIFNAVCALAQHGNEVLVPRPYWVSYPDIIKYSGAEPAWVDLDEKDGFCLRAAQVERAITPRTRMLIANSPSNPTGVVIPAEEFARIYEVCHSRGIWLLTDECYSHFVYGGAKPFSVASLDAAKDTVIVAGSLSKTFAMTGWRMGYALGPKPIVDAMIKLQSQSTSNPTSIAQYAALEALRGPMDSVHTMLAEYTRRRTRILEGLRAIPGITCASPQGAFYAFPEVSGCQKRGVPLPMRPDGRADTALISRQLLEREHLAVLPGEAFGAPGFLRISYATPLERIEKGLASLAAFFTGAKSAS